MRAERDRIPTLRKTDLRIVDEAMHHGIISVPADTSLRAVAQLMADEGVHAVVVRTDGESGTSDDLWGVVTSLDLVAAAVVGVLENQTAGASAATQVLTVEPHTSLTRAAQLMAEHMVTHLVVVQDGTRTPVGVLSTLDVARALGEDDAA